MNVKTAPVTASAPDIIANVPDGMQPIVLARQVEERLKSAPGAETSLVKIWWSELDIELHEVALDILGEAAEVDGPWSKGWQFALSGPIYAGTNEIQRNIAAERHLGLPRK